jgi:DNA (cytosine-5)-methyltransferase 1
MHYGEITVSEEKLRATHVGYYKIGENKGNKRIWIQGCNLTAANFTRGNNYKVVYNYDTKIIILTLSDGVTGRKVSGRKKPDGSYSPIVELSNASLVDVTGGAKRIRADFYENEIHITIHHHEAARFMREESLKKNLHNGIITKGVLCAGIGVSAAASHDAFIDSGIKSSTEFVVDRERKYLDTLVQNNHIVTNDTQIFEATLEEIEPSLLKPINLLEVSLPCTGHSIAGRSKLGLKYAEEHSTDATAIFGLIKIVESCNPAVIVSENVTQARDSTTYILLKGLLELLGYNISETELDNENTKALQNRKRYWLVATSTGLTNVDLTSFPKFETRYNKLSDMLDDNIPDAMWRSTAEKIRKAAVNKANGKGFGFNLVTGDVTTISTIGKGYQKSRATEPHLAGDNDTMRLLTPIEICRSQCIPTHLIANTVAQTGYEGIGQSIDYRQGYGITQLIVKSIMDHQVGTPIQPKHISNELDIF